MADIQGTWDPQYEQVATTLAASLDAGTDTGASVAVLVGGEPVVDIWGGTVDEAGSGPVGRGHPRQRVVDDQDHDVPVRADAGRPRGARLLPPRSPGTGPSSPPPGRRPSRSATSWPTPAGLPGWDEPMQPEDLADWEQCTSLLAAQAPWWEPGTASGYHLVTQGYLIGEVVRRITGVSIGTWFASEVAGPLGADFFIGLPESEEPRVSVVIPPPPMDLEKLQPTELIIRAATNPPLDATYPGHRWWRAAEIPAANGHGNARSVAMVQSVIAGRGEARGVRLLSEAGCDRVFDEQISGTDLILGFDLRFGMGYGLSSSLMPIGPRACYWGGYGGSLIVMDQDAELTICYAMNRMGDAIMGDLRGFGIVAAAVAGLAGG